MISLISIIIGFLFGILGWSYGGSLKEGFDAAVPAVLGGTISFCVTTPLAYAVLFKLIHLKDKKPLKESNIKPLIYFSAIILGVILVVFLMLRVA